MSTRVLYFISGFERGGAEAGLLHLIRKGFFDGVDLVVAAMVGGPLHEDFLAAGVTPIVFSPKPKLGLANSSMSVLKLAALLARVRPDVLILSLPQANVIGRIVGRVMGVPRIIAFEHNAELARPAYTVLYRWTSGLVHEVYADCSETLRIALARHYWPGASKASAVLPLISLSGPPKLGNPRPLRDLVSVGRLTETKNHAAAVHAVALLRDAGVDVTLTIFGEGTLRAPLQLLAQYLNVNDRVSFPGFRPTWWRQGAFDALVLPSRHEGLCMAAVEAMWAGVPVVAPSIGGLRDYADPDSMCVLDDLAPQTIAKALLSISDPWKRRSIAARAQANVCARYGDAPVSETYTKVNAALRASPAPALRTKAA